MIEYWFFYKHLFLCSPKKISAGVEKVSLKIILKQVLTTWIFIVLFHSGIAISAVKLNIKFIMSDDHSATAVGVYGSRFARLVHRIGTSISPRHNIRTYADDLKIDPFLPSGERTHLAYQKYLRDYFRCVKGIDDNLKMLIDYLKESGEWENTIIVYTGKN